MSNMEDNASHQDAAQSDHDEQEMNVRVLNERATKKCGKTFRRPFVFLHERVDSVLQKSKLTSLQEEGRVQVVAFQRRYSPKEIGRHLLSSFPMLQGKDLAT